jgi:hypothetical protein
LRGVFAGLIDPPKWALDPSRRSWWLARRIIGCKPQATFGMQIDVDILKSVRGLTREEMLKFAIRLEEHAKGIRIYAEWAKALGLPGEDPPKLTAENRFTLN